MVGQTVGKYRVVSRLGRGGMGTVYKAVDETLEREVAIKCLNADLAEPDIFKRFRAEAITLARLNHPHIATLFELTAHAGDMLMVMEFVRGETFDKASARLGPMPVDRAARLCAQVLDALAYAHRAGIVHRDLKPANLMLTESGLAKVMDFGIARMVGTEHLTLDGFMMGTPAYMAPEQALGGEIDGRTDLYAMGVVFYRLLTAQLPFKADSGIAMVHKQINDPPTPVRQFRADLPAVCQDILTRAMAKAPGDRYQTAEEFRDALAVLAGLGVADVTATRAMPVLDYSHSPDLDPTMPPMPTPLFMAQPEVARTPMKEPPPEEFLPETQIVQPMGVEPPAEQFLPETQMVQPMGAEPPPEQFLPETQMVQPMGVEPPAEQFLPETQMMQPMGVEPPAEQFLPETQMMQPMGVEPPAEQFLPETQMMQPMPAEPSQDQLLTAPTPRAQPITTQRPKTQSPLTRAAVPAQLAPAPAAPKPAPSSPAQPAPGPAAPKPASSSPAQLAPGPAAPKPAPSSPAQLAPAPAAPKPASSSPAQLAPAPAAPNPAPSSPAPRARRVPVAAVGLILFAGVATIALVVWRANGRVPEPETTSSASVPAVPAPAATPADAAANSAPAPTAAAPIAEPPPTAAARIAASRPKAAARIAAPPPQPAATGSTSEAAPPPEPDPSPPRTESPPVRPALPTVTFANLRLLVTGDGKVDDRGASLHLGSDGLQVVDGTRTLHTAAYQDVIGLFHSHSREPRWATPGGTSAPVAKAGGKFSFLKGTPDWITVRTKNVFIPLRVPGDDLDRVIAALEARTGAKIIHTR